MSRANVHQLIKVWRKARILRDRAEVTVAGAEARLLKLIPRQQCVDSVFHRVSLYLHADEKQLKDLGLLRKVQSLSVDARKLRALADKLPNRYTGAGKAIVPEHRHALVDWNVQGKSITYAEARRP